VNEQPLVVPVILGSIRDGRRSANAARVLYERLVALGHRSSILDLLDLELPMFTGSDDEEAHPGVIAFRTALAGSDASVWLSPEYNHAYTGVIKNAIDLVHTELHRKPVAACGLSAGAHGGIRATEALKSVLIEMRALPIRDSVHFGEARTLFNSDGSLARPEVISRVDHMIEELAWHARALRWARATLPVPPRP
jgi:NAD(P)H-dependent FMN reductase